MTFHEGKGTVLPVVTSCHAVTIQIVIGMPRRILSATKRKVCELDNEGSRLVRNGVRDLCNALWRRRWRTVIPDEGVRGERERKMKLAYIHR
jgi:hypothetical protein